MGRCSTDSGEARRFGSRMRIMPVPIVEVPGSFSAREILPILSTFSVTEVGRSVEVLSIQWRV